MELALALGVTLLGWQLSSRSANESSVEVIDVVENEKNRRKTKSRGASHAKGHQQSAGDKEETFASAGARAWSSGAAANAPPAPRPYYTERRTAGPSDAAKNRTLETYAGFPGGEAGSDGVWRSKREVGPFFENRPQNITYSGGQGSAVEYERRMPTPSTLQNNTSAIAPRQIGPGLDRMDGTNMTGMFDTYRPPDEDLKRAYINEHRIHQFEGRPEHGASRIGERPSENFLMRAPTDTRFHTYEQRPPLPGSAMVSAHTTHGEYSKPQCGPWPTDADGENWIHGAAPGAAGKAGYAPPETGMDRAANGAWTTDRPPVGATRLRSDSGKSSMPMGPAGPSGGMHSAGGYVNSEFDHQKFDMQQRGRGDAYMVAGAAGGPLAPSVGGGFAMAATNRSLNDAPSLGGAKHFTSAGAQRPLDGGSRPTLRETAHALPAGGAGLALAPQAGPPTRANSTLLRESKRSKHLTATRLAPGRQHSHTGASQLNVHLKDDSRMAILGSHAQSYASTGAQPTVPLGKSASTGPKICSETPNQDFSLARNILKKNDFAITT